MPNTLETIASVNSARQNNDPEAFGQDLFDITTNKDWFNRGERVHQKDLELIMAMSSRMVRWVMEKGIEQDEREDRGEKVENIGYLKQQDFEVTWLHENGVVHLMLNSTDKQGNQDAIFATIFFQDLSDYIDNSKLRKDKFLHPIERVIKSLDTWEQNVPIYTAQIAHRWFYPDDITEYGYTAQVFPTPSMEQYHSVEDDIKAPPLRTQKGHLMEVLFLREHLTAEGSIVPGVSPQPLSPTDLLHNTQKRLEDILTLNPLDGNQENEVRI